MKKYRDKKWLEKEYVMKHKSITDIAEERGRSKETIYRRSRKNN